MKMFEPFFEKMKTIMTLKENQHTKIILALLEMNPRSI